MELALAWLPVARAKRRLLLCQLRALSWTEEQVPPYGRTEEQVPPWKQSSAQQAGLPPVGKALPSPHPIPIVASKLAPPLVVVGGLTFVDGTRRQFSDLASQGRRVGELPPQPSSSLAAPRRAPAEAGYSRSVIVTSPVSPQGADRRASSSLSQLGRSVAPPQTPPPIVQDPKGSFSPLGVVAGFTFLEALLVSSPGSPVGRPGELPRQPLRLLPALGGRTET